MMGLATALVKDYLPETEGFFSRDDIWFYAKNMGTFRFVCGW